MVDVSYTRHDNEREIMKEPPKNRVEAGVVNLVNLVLREVFEASLPSEDVPNSD